MAKKRKSKIPKRRRSANAKTKMPHFFQAVDAPTNATWFEGNEIHSIVPAALMGKGLDADSLSKEFQQQIRNSPMWDQMVAEFGLQRAEELLLQCRGEARPLF